MGAEEPVTAESSASKLLAIASRLWFDDLADRGIIVTDAALVICAWNRWLATQTGVSAQHAVGKPLFEVCPTIKARGLEEQYLRALAGEVRVLAHRFHKYLIPVLRTAATAGAGEGTQTARIVPLLSDGEVVGTISIIEDVSERVVSERELRNQILVSERARAVAEDASRLKDEFLATLSHEIRTPLNAVLGWTQILRSQKSAKSPAHALQVIERNASSQLRLVEDLLDMARIVSGKLRLDVKPIDVQAVVQAAVDVVEPGAAAKGVEIRSHFDHASIPVNADADRLQQAIWNVMSNALKFTSTGGAIDVAVVARGRVVTISVGDTGQGISAEFLPYVFDRFRQADASASRRHGGLGLGLALTRQIVELHGGSIKVESAGTDKGSTFSIRLPIADTLVQTAVVTRSVLSEDSLEGVTVLLADDSRDGREMLEVALRGYGADVFAVESSDAAIAALESATVLPDIVISDIGMPGSDGYELIRRIRASPEPIRSTPAMAVTAYADPEDRIRALAAGYQMHLAKPADPAIVADSIQRLVAATRALRLRS
jgi:signal transduction histidine kinase/CheY-like chemotaxis protein